MTVTADPSTSALLVLHYQNGIVKPDGVFAFSGTAAQVAKHGTPRQDGRRARGGARAAG